MIDALLGAAMMYGFADKPTINIERPHKGDYSNVIVRSARVPERWKPFASCVLDRESGGHSTTFNQEFVRVTRGLLLGPLAVSQLAMESRAALCGVTRTEEERDAREHAKKIA